MQPRPRTAAQAPADAAPPPGLGPGWAQLPDYRLFDLVALLWRERLTAILAAALVTALGLVAVLALPREYTANSRVLVVPDESYDPEPVARTPGFQGGASVSANQIVQTEAEILGSDEVKRRMIRRLGIGRVAPDVAKDPTAADPERALALAVRAVSQEFGVRFGPTALTIDAFYTSENPDTAAAVLNAMVEEYLEFRLELFLSQFPSNLPVQREAAEVRLDQINAEIEALLRANTIGDFDAERAAIQERAAQVEVDLLSARAARAEAESRLAAIERQLAAASPTIDLYTDDGAAGRLQDLLVEREELLTRFRPEARVVQELDQRIARLQESFAAGGVDGGLTRRGPNPLYQELETQRAQIEAEAEAQRAREAALAGQAQTLRARQLELQAATPQFDRLTRERSVLEETVRAIALNETSRAARAAIQDQTVRVVQTATPPTQGRSLRRVAFLGVLMAAGFTGLLAALVRGLARKRAPTPDVAARTLGAPILAVVRTANAAA